MSFGHFYEVDDGLRRLLVGCSSKSEWYERSWGNCLSTLVRHVKRRNPFRHGSSHCRASSHAYSLAR